MIPRNHKSPTGTDKKVAGANRQFDIRLKAIRKQITERVIKPLESKRIALNASAAYMLNKEYIYQLSAIELANIDRTIADIIASYIMIDENGFPVNADTGSRLWFFSMYGDVAYKQGTTQAFTELSTQSTTYSNATQQVEDILYSEPYQRRIGLVAAREFNEMQGFNDLVVKEARRVLSQGIALGQGVDEISRNLSDRIDVSYSRARTISRTEITYALRKAKRDESASAEVRLGVQSKLVWMASMLPRMRPWHFNRTGNLYTRQEVDEFYAEGANSINCRCTQILVVVDSEGNPLNDKIVERLVKLKEDNRDLATVNMKGYFNFVISRT